MGKMSERKDLASDECGWTLASFGPIKPLSLKTLHDTRQYNTRQDTVRQK